MVLSSLSEFLDGLLEVFFIGQVSGFRETGGMAAGQPPAMESKFSHYQLGKERRMMTVSKKFVTNFIWIILKTCWCLDCRQARILWMSELVTQNVRIKLTGITDTSETDNIISKSVFKYWPVSSSELQWAPQLSLEDYVFQWIRPWPGGGWHFMVVIFWRSLSSFLLTPVVMTSHGTLLSLTFPAQVIVLSLSL